MKFRNCSYYSYLLSHSLSVSVCGLKHFESRSRIGLHATFGEGIDKKLGKCTKPFAWAVLQEPTRIHGKNLRVLKNSGSPFRWFWTLVRVGYGSCQIHSWIWSPASHHGLILRNFAEVKIPNPMSCHDGFASVGKTDHCFATLFNHKVFDTYGFFLCLFGIGTIILESAISMKKVTTSYEKLFFPFHSARYGQFSMKINPRMSIKLFALSAFISCVVFFLWAEIVRNEIAYRLQFDIGFFYR